VLRDDVLRLMRDVEFSIDFPTRESHDVARARGNWDLIDAQMARCRALGVSTAIVTVLMSSNHRAMKELVALAGARGSLLRVNVYQPVRHDLASPTFDEFWRAWSDLLEVADVVACGEPIVRAVLGWPAIEGEGCGRNTLRLTPRGEIVGCVYEQDARMRIEDLVRVGSEGVESHDASDALPAACEPCAQRNACRGGCTSRRRLAGGVAAPDAYCPFVRGANVAVRKPPIPTGPVPPKAASACTTILRPRAVASS
jgi:radical SAM protein with 4Fe4S-binding SPASM domain